MRGLRKHQSKNLCSEVSLYLVLKNADAILVAFLKAVLAHVTEITHLFKNFFVGPGTVAQWRSD